MTSRPLALALLVSACQLLADEPKDKVPSHLAAARALVREVTPDTTSYRHKDTVVRWADGDKPAECHTDCSGLMNSLLEKVRPGSEKQFPKWLGKRRPLAENYHDAIEAGKGFVQIEKVADIRPGDVLAAKYEPGSSNTGHVMIVDEVPTMREATKPIVDGTRQWEIVIIDSTSSSHGKTDTRLREDGTSRSGVGRGTLRVYANEDGTIAGYTWSVAAGSEFRPQKARHLVAGRLKAE